MFKRYFNKKRIARGVEIEDSIMTITEKEKAIIETPLERKGLNILWYLMIVFIIFLAGRVFYLDTVQGEYYADLSRGNRIRQIVIKAPRGKILDKYGKTLVRNVPSIDVIAIPHDLPKTQEEIEALSQKLSSILELDQENTKLLLESQDKKSLNPVLVKENITKDQALILSEKIGEISGVSIEKTAIRNYESSNIFSSVIGYDGKITREELKNNSDYLMTDYIGKAGIEKSYEKELRGIHGARQVEVDSSGNVKKDLGVINPQAGNDIILHIDEELQKKIYDSLTGILEKTGTKTAAAVAIDPRNGGVLAMVSLPSFDNNMFARGITNDEYQALVSDKNLPLFNRAVNGEYPPGSTIKPVVAAAGLSEGVISPSTTMDDNGGAISIGSWRFGDWKVHGLVDVKKAIAESCDVFFYAVGGGYGNISGLGMERMKKYDNLFGLGAPTGIDLQGEAAGLIPSEEWKFQEIGEKWYMGNSYHASIGQGYVRSTPLQLANMTAALANGGTLYSPKIVSRVRESNGTERLVNSSIVRKDFISSQVMEIVRQGMRQTVTDGTAQPLKDLPVEVAGKTGTAEFGVEKGHTHAWFVSFAPYDNPEIAMVVLAEGAGEGHSSAVPVTKEVLEWYFSRGK